MLIRLIFVLIPAVFLFACAQENSSAANDAVSVADQAAETAVGQVAAAGNVAEGAAATAETALLVGDPESGKRFYIFCQACHSINEGGMNKVGPNLYGVFDKPAGQVEGFVYSEALTAAGINWDKATLDRWITRPSETVPGTTMVFAGINDPQQRADLIAYLKQVGSE
jgi:cytochrome c